MDLDSLITDAAPPVTDRRPELTAALTTLVADAESAVRSRGRRRRRLALVSSIAAVAISGTAAGVLPTHWTSWLSSAHRTCQIQVVVGPAGPDLGIGEPKQWPTHVDHARRDRMVADARRFVATFDYGSIDQAEAVRVYKAREAKIIAQQRASEPADQVQPPLDGDDLIGMAIRDWVLERLDAHLAHEGYDMSTRKGSEFYLLTAETTTVCK